MSKSGLPGGKGTSQMTKGSFIRFLADNISDEPWQWRDHHENGLVCITLAERYGGIRCDQCDLMLIQEDTIYVWKLHHNGSCVDRVFCMPECLKAAMREAAAQFEAAV